MGSKLDCNRRSFLKGVAMLGAVPLISGGSMAQQTGQSPQVPSGEVPKKALGRTVAQVSARGLAATI